MEGDVKTEVQPSAGAAEPVIEVKDTDEAYWQKMLDEIYAEVKSAEETMSKETLTEVRVKEICTEIVSKAFREYIKGRKEGKYPYPEDEEKARKKKYPYPEEEEKARKCPEGMTKEECEEWKKKYPYPAKELESQEIEKAKKKYPYPEGEYPKPKATVDECMEEMRKGGKLSDECKKVLAEARKKGEMKCPEGMTKEECDEFKKKYPEPAKSLEDVEKDFGEYREKTDKKLQELNDLVEIIKNQPATIISQTSEKEDFKGYSSPYKWTRDGVSRK